ncbi:alpha/beta hydrolase [Kribbella sp. NBC_00382]|uniref:alpha/beta fold hydrolase n=1 Tax=Kribbella sp. NBC_00382 TaxID=2975967 RepID=UPI002E2377B8
MSTQATEPTITEEIISVWNGKITMRVKVAGAGTPLLYLHPAAGLAWDPFLSHLAERYTVYAPEFPGTSVGDPHAIHNIDDLGDVVLAYEELVRKLGLTKPVVVGQSFGGMLAAELASTFPDLPSALVLLDPIGLWLEDHPPANWIITPPDKLPALLFHDPSSAAAQAMLAMPEDPDQQIAAIAGMVWAFGCTGKFAFPIPDRGLRKRLHRISVRTLVVWGRDDRLVNVAYADAFANAVAGSKVAIIDDCGHIPQVEKYADTVTAVDEFLG